MLFFGCNVTCILDLEEMRDKLDKLEISLQSTSQEKETPNLEAHAGPSPPSPLAGLLTPGVPPNPSGPSLPPPLSGVPPSPPP